MTRDLQINKKVVHVRAGKISGLFGRKKEDLKREG
jgi:hypothetical protein